MPLSDADTRAKLIDRALHAQGWTADLSKPEEVQRDIWPSFGCLTKGYVNKSKFSCIIKEILKVKDL